VSINIGGFSPGILFVNFIESIFSSPPIYLVSKTAFLLRGNLTLGQMKGLGDYNHAAPKSSFKFYRSRSLLAEIIITPAFFFFFFSCFSTPSTSCDAIDISIIYVVIILANSFCKWLIYWKGIPKHSILFQIGNMVVVQEVFVFCY